MNYSDKDEIIKIVFIIIFLVYIFLHTLVKHGLI